MPEGFLKNNAKILLIFCITFYYCPTYAMEAGSDLLLGRSVQEDLLKRRLEIMQDVLHLREDTASSFQLAEVIRKIAQLQSSLSATAEPCVGEDIDQVFACIEKTIPKDILEELKSKIPDESLLAQIIIGLFLRQIRELSKFSTGLLRTPERELASHFLREASETANFFTALASSAELLGKYEIMSMLLLGSDFFGKISQIVLALRDKDRIDKTSSDLATWCGEAMTLGVRLDNFLWLLKINKESIFVNEVIKMLSENKQAKSGCFLQ